MKNEEIINCLHNVVQTLKEVRTKNMDAVKLQCGIFSLLDLQLIGRPLYQKLDSADTDLYCAYRKLEELVQELAPQNEEELKIENGEQEC